jgi:uncharacterized protein YcbX
MVSSAGGCAGASAAGAEEQGAPRRATVRALYRYPVKGLSPEPLASVALAAGETIPFDRAYAIENGPGRFDAAQPRHLPKTNFLMLMRNERLACLSSRFDDATHTLTLARQGRQVARADLASALGRRLIEQFFAAYMEAELRGPPKVVCAPGHSFSDVAAKCVHIVNLDSVRALERMLGRSVDPRRFRANLYLEGIEPWSELRWVGRRLRAGAVRLAVIKRTSRCAATNVDPATGARDLAIPASLQRALGHADFGVYAVVEDGGEIGVGAAVQVSD